MTINNPVWGCQRTSPIKTDNRVLAGHGWVVWVLERRGAVQRVSTGLVIGAGDDSARAILIVPTAAMINTEIPAAMRPHSMAFSGLTPFQAACRMLPLPFPVNASIKEATALF